MKTVPQFREWLESSYEKIDGLFEPAEPSDPNIQRDEVCYEPWADIDQSNYNAAARIVNQASEHARRLGAPDVVHKSRWFEDDTGCCGREEAKNALGLMLRWCRENELDKIKSLTWLTTKQAALYFQVSEDFIRDRCNDGTLPHQRVGREYRIKRLELDRMLVEDDW